MFCPYCGTSLPETSKFCTNCGNSMPIVSDQAATSPGSPVVDDGTTATTPDQTAVPSAASTPTADQVASSAPTSAPAAANAAPTQGFAAPGPVDGTPAAAGSTPIPGYAPTPAGAGAAPGYAPAGAGPAPGYPLQAPTTPPPVKGGYSSPKRSKLPLFIGIGAAVVVVAIIGVGFALGWFGGARGPVYAVSEINRYDSDGEQIYHSAYTRDDRGSNTSLLVEILSSDVKQEIDYECDENGYIEKTKQKIKTGSDTSNSSSTIDNEFDDKGRLVKVTAKSGDSKTITEYTYHDNGGVKSRTMTFGLTDTVISREFDENGYQIKNTYRDKSNDTEDLRKFEWKFDSNNKPTAVTEKHVDSSSDAETIKYTVETDSDGNITALVDEDGARVEYSYQKVANPSPCARMMASCIEYL